MKQILSFCVFFFCVYQISAQSFITTVTIDDSPIATEIPGSIPFDLEFNLRRTGILDNVTTCRFTFDLPTTLSVAALQNCTAFSDFVVECPIVWAFNTSFETRSPISGPTSVAGCSGTTWTLSYNCQTPALVNNTGQFMADLSSSSADLESLLINVDINDSVVDYNDDPQFSVLSRVVNENDCVVSGVRCTITYPQQFETTENPGLVDLITDNANSTVLEQNCGLDGSVLTCPSVDQPAFTMAALETIDIVTVFELTGNGTLNFNVSCNATGLIDFSDTFDALQYVGINVPLPPVAPIISDDSDDLIANTAIPLAIFGFVMIILITFIFCLIVAYIIYSKAISEESL